MAMTIGKTFSFPRDPPLPPIAGTAAAAHQDSASPNDAILGNEEVVISSKLSNVESQRIMSVLQELQTKIQIVDMLPDTIDRRANNSLLSETIVMIRECKGLEERYRALAEKRAQMDKSSVDAEELNSEMKEVGKSLRTLTRSICRHVMQTPGTTSKLKYLKFTKNPPILQFESLISEIKGLVYERLRTTVEEEKARQDQLSVIIAKEQRTSNEVRALKDDVEKAKKERTAEVNKRNEIIRRLKEELRDIKQQAEETTKRMESRSKQKEDQEMQTAREKPFKEASMKQEISSLQSQLSDLTKKNREEEAQLRKKKFKIESEVENWIHKYDQDMDEKQSELEDLTAIYMEEKSQLDELQARYNELQREYERIMEERRLAQEAKKEQEKLHRRMMDAATLIQAVYRGYRVRKELLKKKAAANKTGGKKKK
ncbi:hypothetical protein HDU67_005817 [Dinochytrium kinnereticum]|nr:hypothetical protein HDU67_005817 [Dinochytrium kinnereticum]